MEPDCLFCGIAANRIPSTKVYEDGDYMAFRDINPAAPIHILVIPKLHRAGLSACGPEDAALLGGLMETVITVAKQEKLESFRTVINTGSEAGQTVFHLHVHLVGGRPMGERIL